MFYFLFPIICVIFNGVFDHVNMNINDMLNPIEDNNDQGKFTKYSDNNQGDPNHNDHKRVSSDLKDNSSNEYRALADKLQNKREEVLEQRRSVGATSTHTNFSDLGCRFQRYISRAQEHDAKLIRDVFPGALSTTTVNPAKIMQIREFKP